MLLPWQIRDFEITRAKWAFIYCLPNFSKKVNNFNFCAQINRRFSNGTENTIPWVLEQVDQNGMMGPPMGRVHPSIVGCPLGSFIGQIGHVPKIYPLYRENFNRASCPPWVTEAKPFYHQLYVYRCPWKSHKKVGQKMPTLVGNQFFLICCPMGISPTWHGILGNVLGFLESPWSVLSDERIKKLGSWNLDPEKANWKIS